MDLDAKKKLLRHIPSGLYVIGVRSGEAVNAFTGSWMSQASMKPPAVALGIRSDSHSLEMIRASGVFSVNFIKKDGSKILEHFFKPIKHEGGRLGDIAYHPGQATQAPILEVALGFLECRVMQITENFGDHVIVVGEVVNAVLKEDVPPLIMSDTPWKYGG